MIAKHLEWDSDFFGIQISKIVTENDDNDSILKKVKKLSEEGSELIYIQSFNALDLDFFDSCGYEIIDMGGKVLYHKDISKVLTSHNQIKSYENNNVSDKLLDLALQSGAYSRFKLDKKLPADAFERLYKIWIENSVKKIIADEVLVFMIENEIAGMITLAIKENWGDIGLIAVDKNFRGQKIGYHLLNAANNYFYSKNIKDLGVETQTINIGACRFYEANGFLVHKSEYLYHCRPKTI